MAPDVQSRSAADRASLYRPVFVGREAELQRLQSAYEDAVEVDRFWLRLQANLASEKRRCAPSSPDT